MAPSGPKDPTLRKIQVSANIIDVYLSFGDQIFGNRFILLCLSDMRIISALNYYNERNDNAESKFLSDKITTVMRIIKK